MTDSTTEFWAIDGVSLSQYGWSVTTFGGSRYDLPPRRGDNLRFAYRPGTVHRAKQADSRVIDLKMWVTGTTPATGASVSDPRLQFNDSWDFLRRLVWRPNGDQVTLTRRWWLTVGGSSTLVTADAQAEIADTMTPTMTGRHRADFSMTLLLADPYFYGPEVTVPIPLNTPTVINNPGHDTAAFGNVSVQFLGALNNPRLTNATPTPDVWVQYTGSLLTGNTLTLDVGAYTATFTSPQTTYFGTGTNAIGDITHSGARNWMGLLKGNNTLTLSGSGAGSAVLRYRPPYV